jgi:hypothetical protein
LGGSRAGQEVIFKKNLHGPLKVDTFIPDPASVLVFSLFLTRGERYKMLLKEKTYLKSHENKNKIITENHIP